MRRTTRTAIPVGTTAVALAATLLLAGCGSEKSGTSAGHSGKGGTVSSTPTGCPAKGQLTAADNGRTVCLSKGDELRLTLDGTKGRPWKPVSVQGKGLEAINAGIVLQPGDASGAWRATASGTVKLVSSRPLCAQPTTPGAVSCKGIQNWTVTVRVS
jgi:hypothetical protein